MKKSDGMVVSRTTVYRWTGEYSPLLYKFSRSLRPILGPKWHCGEAFRKILEMDGWLFAAMDASTGYILSCDVSDTKAGYKPLPLFEEARRVACVDPWIFVTDGLTAFIKATSKAFRILEGFRLMHVRDIHIKNLFNTNNLCERLNGEFKDSIKTIRGFKLKPDKKTDGKPGGGCPALLRLLVVHRNFFRPHLGLNYKTPAEAAGITIRGDNGCITVIAGAARAQFQNAARPRGNMIHTVACPRIVRRANLEWRKVAVGRSLCLPKTASAG